MKRLLVGAAIAVACVSVSGCGTLSGGDPARVLEALGTAYGHCQRTVTYSAQVGPLNTASGASITGTVNCPARTDPAVPIRTPEG